MSKTIKDYFDIQELVCRDTYNKYGNEAWQFLDDRLLANLLWIRENLGKPIYVNSWAIGGKLSERGLRCNLCSLVASKTKAGTLYLSAHQMGKAVDFDVKDMKAEEVRKWIVANAARMPYPCRLENYVTWVHMDVRCYNQTQKVKLFNA